MVLDHLSGNARAHGASEVVAYVEEDSLIVQDNGSGISQGNRNRIFEPFFSTKASGEGTGLGLSMVYDMIVQGHRGMLRLESEEGEFSEFIVTLPKAASTP